MGHNAIQIGARFIRAGLGLLTFGMLMSFGIVGHYIVGARWPTGELFLKNIRLRYACPWSLSTAVVLISAGGMIAIGGAYATLGRGAPQDVTTSRGRVACAICCWSLIGIFVVGYAGYFVFDRVWPGFYYLPIKEGKDAWLLAQLASRVASMVGVMLASAGMKRLTQSPA